MSDSPQPSAVAPHAHAGVAAPAPDLRQGLTALGLLAALTLMMFADVLFTSAPIVLSNRTTDLFSEYSHWRAFGFDELRHGHFALWNPCLFCGAPFFGGGQAALLYPLNVLFLFPPLHHAINWSIALHVFLAGAFTYAWAAHRRLASPACFLSAVIFMFCGANFLHIYSGYLSFLCGFVWAPLLFLAIDGLFERPSLGWSLLGMFAAAMQVFAGNPQCLFYTGVAAALYCFLCWFRVEARGRFALGLAGIVLGGGALSAIQLIASIQAWGELLRSSGVPFDFAASFSFPPENLLTLLVPHFFGDFKTVSYWGRSYLWEMCLFVGVSGFVLAVAGAIWGDRRVRRFSTVMVLLLLLLALGAHTPLFKVLYDWGPGFNRFRGNSKFIFLVSLFLALLAGVGFDQLLRGRRLPGGFLGTLGAMGLLLLGGAALVRPSATASGLWHNVLLAVGKLGESYVPAAAYSSEAFVTGTARMASHSLAIAGVLIIVVAILIWCQRRWRPAAALLLVLAVAELIVFGRLSLDRFDLEEAVDPAIKGFLEQHPGDFRISNLDYPNSALSLRAQDVWGYEPGVVLRYAQLVAFADGLRPDQAERLTTLGTVFRPDHPLLSLLRCRYLFAEAQGHLQVLERTNYLPHLLLVQRCRVLASQDEIFSTLTNADFNPGQEVILETKPDPAPAASAKPGTVRLADYSADALTIEAELPAASILVIPDVYAKGWRARGLPGSAQGQYRVLPADWCLRAIPLEAGHHRLRLEYAPAGFRLGRVVSLAFLPLFCLLVAWTAVRFAQRGGFAGAWAGLGSKSCQAPGGDAAGEGRFDEAGRFALVLAASLAAAALLAFWPLVGRTLLEYGGSPVPLIGPLLLLLWGAWNLGKCWRHQVWRMSALILALVAVLVPLAYSQVGYWRQAAAFAGSPRDADKVGEALLKQGFLDEAIGHFQDLLKTNAALPAAQQNLAVALLRRGRAEEAIPHLRAAVELDSRLAGAQSSLASLLLQRGRYDEAIAHYQAAATAQPTNANYLNNLAWVLATCPLDSARNGARALELARQADQLSGGRNLAVLGTLAAAYAETGQLPAAIKTAQDALALATSQTNLAQLNPLRTQLEAYRAGSAFRDTAPASTTNHPPDR